MNRFGSDPAENDWKNNQAVKKPEGDDKKKYLETRAFSIKNAGIILLIQLYLVMRNLMRYG